ncbi:MAG: LysR family transcriptional regulator [Proteobacteria bacterium]|nr:LysR family transcriptional regulator [Pseudomonadota bacterium]
MRLAGIDLNLLVVLDALLTESSVTGAARRIGLSQSATSHALARLRQLLGDPVLVRTSQGMVPTARARALSQPVREILEEAEGVFRGPREFDPASSTAIFRLGLEDAAQVTVLPALVERIQERAPGVSLRVVRAQPDEMLRDFEAARIDVAVTPHVPFGVRELHSEQLISADWVSVVRRGHPDVGKRLSLKRFVELGHIVVVHPNLADRAIEDALARRSRSRRIVLTVPSPATIPFLVSRTDLVATLPSMLLDRGGAPRDLARYRPPIDLEPVAVFLLHHSRTHQSAAHQWLREQIRAVFEGLARR